MRASLRGSKRKICWRCPRGRATRSFCACSTKTYRFSRSSCVTRAKRSRRRSSTGKRWRCGMDKLLVSACLLGTPAATTEKVKRTRACRRWWENMKLFLSAPNSSAVSRRRVCPANGGARRVITAGGRDVTEAYRRGAEAALALCQQNGCEAAVLKEKSPSCGCGDLRRNFFPPPDRGRRRDSGGAQGTRYHHIWRERCGEAVNADDMA